MQRKSTVRLLMTVLLGLSSLTTGVRAGELFALSDNDQLYTIDTNTLAVTLIGFVGTNSSFGGLAYDANTATLYMIGGRSNDNLYTLNQSTGAATLIGNHGRDDLFGLAFDTLNNVLYGSHLYGNTELVTLNTVTGAATVVGSMDVGIGGLAYDSNRDQLVGVNDGPGDLYGINRATAATTMLLDTDFVNDSGLAYDPDLDLFWDIDFDGNLITFDPSNGYARTSIVSGLGSFSGLAYKAVVPEPASLLLASLALLSISGCRRK
jgi:hypothetical protein